MLHCRSGDLPRRQVEFIAGDRPEISTRYKHSFVRSICVVAGLVVKHVDGELRFNSGQEYWSFMTEISPTVVAGLTKADEPTRKKIETTALDLARKTSPDGKPRLAWSASTISATK
jgi:hypothetical protein